MKALVASQTVLLLLAVTIETYSTAMREYCEGETFWGNCQRSDELLVVRSAIYGRMNEGRCIQNNEHLSCRDDVLSQVDSLCSGQKRCSFLIHNQTFQSLPCPRGYQSYLEIVHDCLKVVMAPKDNNCDSEHQVLLKNNYYGYISSYMAHHYGFGGAKCPWRIEVSRGQRINFSLIDFSRYNWRSSYLGVGRGGEEDYIYHNYYQHENRCFKYGIVQDKLARQSERICGGNEREKHILLTRSSIVELKLFTVENSRNLSFLIKFHAIGCGKPIAPRNGWVEQDSSGVWVGCNGSSESWALSCDEINNNWVGNFRNCSDPVEGGFLMLGRVYIPQSASIAIVIIMSLIAVVISLILSLICFEWFKGGKKRFIVQEWASVQEEVSDQQQNQQFSSPSLCTFQHESNQQKLVNTFPKQQKQQIQFQHNPVQTPQQPKTSGELKLKPILRNAHNYQQQQVIDKSQSQQTQNQFSQPQMTIQAQVFEDPLSSEISKIQLYPNSSSIISTATLGRKFIQQPQQSQLQAQQTTISTLPRNTTDYAREVWPMALPPSSKMDPPPRPDSRMEATRNTLFTYGDSATLIQGPHNNRSSLLIRNTESNSEPSDDTHIYETPKYLRKEKAATMRLQISKTSNNQPHQKTLSFYEPEIGVVMGAKEDQQKENGASDMRTIKTLPRKVLATTTSVKL